MRIGSLQKQRGAETVEFIVTVPVILLLFFLFVDLGIAAADKAVITDASRAAAREVIRGRSDAQAWSAADAVLKSAIIWTGSAPYTCDSSTKCPIVPSDRSALNPGDEVTVTVNFPYEFRFLGVLSVIGEKLNLSGRTVMRMLPH